MIPMAEAVWRQNVAVTSEISPCSSATSLSQKSSFQAFPWRQKLFRNGHCTLTPAISSLQPKSSQVVPSHPKSSHVIPSRPRSSQVIPSHSMSFQIHHPCPKGSPPLGSRPLNDMSNAVPGSPTSAARKRPMIHQAWNPKLRGVSTMRACMQNNTGEKSKRTSVRWRARVTATKQDRTTKTKELAATQLCADLAARLWMSLLRRESSANERRKIESRTKLHSADTRFQSYTDLRNYSGNYSTIPSVQDSWKRSNPSTVCGLPNFSRLHFGKNLQKSGEVQRVLAAAWGV